MVKLDLHVLMFSNNHAHQYEYCRVYDRSFNIYVHLLYVHNCQKETNVVDH